jgi:ribonucleoside-diphosphate reductase alpha chain
MWEASNTVWKDVVKLGKQHGIRNSQSTVLAPTGTIGFMMDCDTTGVEPDIALVKYKKLVGGGLMKIVNQTVPEALRKLGYDDEQVEHIVAYIDNNDTIERSPHLREEHLPVFDCAFKPANGQRSIQYMGHIKMMAAVQPFLSGAISKTVNMPTDITAEEIQHAYVEAWRLGLKAIAVYRDGCKRTQPLSTSLETKKESSKVHPLRRRLPDERQSITHKFSIAGHEGYITVGMFEDGMPGEVFITMSKEGSTISGMMDSFATSISIALQYGVPLKVLVDKFSHARFEPSGFTNNPEIPIAKSISDYIFRWLGLKFLPKEDAPTTAATMPTATQVTPQARARQDSSQRTASAVERNEKVVFQTQADAPPCHECGSIMIRSGSCYKCLQCGSTSGCS